MASQHTQGSCLYSSDDLLQDGERECRTLALGRQRTDPPPDERFQAAPGSRAIAKSWSGGAPPALYYDEERKPRARSRVLLNRGSAEGALAEVRRAFARLGMIAGRSA